MTNSRQSAHPETALPHVGTYRRAMDVSLERMYENTLDWEHLPYVHNSSFGSINCVEAGRWGWRAELTDTRGNPSLIELRLDRESRRWITRNIEGSAAGSEIWTHVFVTGERSIEIVVDFFVPDVDPAKRDRIGAAYTNLYHQLYDEDEAMMRIRQHELDQRITSTEITSVDLPKRSQLEFPHTFELAGRRHVLREINGELVAHAALCPHQLGPLENAELKNGVVTCPWHGYQFDLASGARVNPEANGALSVSNCTLRAAPVVSESAGGVRVSCQ